MKNHGPIQSNSGENQSVIASRVVVGLGNGIVCAKVKLGTINPAPNSKEKSIFFIIFCFPCSREPRETLSVRRGLGGPLKALDQLPSALGYMDRLSASSSTSATSTRNFANTAVE